MYMYEVMYNTHTEIVLNLHLKLFNQQHVKRDIGLVFSQRSGGIALLDASLPILDSWLC